MYAFEREMPRGRPDAMVLDVLQDLQSLFHSSPVLRRNRDVDHLSAPESKSLRASTRMTSSCRDAGTSGSGWPAL